MLDEQRDVIWIREETPFEVLDYPHGTSVVVVPQAVTWIKTSATGHLILRSLRERPRPLAELLNDVARHYGLPVERIAPSVRRLVDELVVAGVAGWGAASRLPLGPAPGLEELGLQELWFNLTDRCNLTCPFCYVPSTGPAGGHVPLSLAVRVIEEAAELGVRHLVLAGGEPTLHPDLAEIVRVARRQGSLRVKLVTNGARSDEALLETVWMGVDDLQVSLDGADEGEHDRLRGKGSFRRALDLLTAVRRRAWAGKVGLSFTPLPHNLDQLIGLYRLALGMGVDYIHLNRPKVPGRQQLGASENGDMASQAHFSRALGAYDQLLLHAYRDREFATGLSGRAAVDIDVSFDPATELFSRVVRRRCAAGLLTMCVGPDGACYPCAALCRPEYSWGKVGEHSLHHISRVMRRDMLEKFDVDRDPSCSGCLFRYFCGGGCRAVTGRLDERDPACQLLAERFRLSLGHVTDVRAAGYTRRSNESLGSADEPSLRPRSSC